MRESLASTVIREGDTLRSRLQPEGELQSIGGLLRANLDRFADHDIYRQKKGGTYRGVTWEEFAQTVVACMEFLLAKGVRPGDRVAAISRNRGELLIAEFATMSLGAVYVPIFAGYSGLQTAGLLEQSQSRIVFMEGSDQLMKTPMPAHVQTVISFDAVTHQPPGRGPDTLAWTLVRMEELLARSSVHVPGEPTRERLLRAAATIDPREPCLMMYTSGTAGEQKGVLLSHDNILSQQRALARIWELDASDRFLSYLPWHHSFGGIFEKYGALFNGAPLAIDDSYGKDSRLLLENWREIRPTVYFSVPLIHQELVGHVLMHPEEEPEIFHRELKFVFTAAAPLPSNISDFFESRRIPVVEGWGLTETSPCCTVTDLHERRSTPGVVGYPIPGVVVRVADDGEILVRGPNVMRGYFRNEEATSRAFPGDGWFHTGDLGAIEDRALRLISRKDRVFKMLNAEKVVPTVLENKLAGRNKYVRHALVVGNGRGYLAALIFPNYFLIQEEFGSTHEEADRIVLDSLRRTIDELNAENPVKYEHIQAFAIVTRELSVEAGDLTPSMKVRVQNVLDSSGDFVEAIYDPLNDCDCSLLRKVIRLIPEQRLCPMGKGLGLDRCHECGPQLFDQTLGGRD